MSDLDEREIERGDHDREHNDRSELGGDKDHDHEKDIRNILGDLHMRDEGHGHRLRCLRIP